jgi:hypothetical protein
MKVLSIQQPWASLIVHGLKRCELRSWSTNYRGRLAIHAARRFGFPQRRLCMEGPVCGLLASVSIRRLADLPRGAISGTVTLLDCVPAGDVDRREYNADFAWLLADPLVLAEPIPYVGQLGLCNVPEAIAAALSATMR